MNSSSHALRRRQHCIPQHNSQCQTLDNTNSSSADDFSDSLGASSTMILSRRKRQRRRTSLFVSRQGLLLTVLLCISGILLSLPVQVQASAGHTCTMVEECRSCTTSDKRLIPECQSTGKVQSVQCVAEVDGTLY
jgi:hypothetical protein